jgi:hypothetical protein
LSGFVKQEDLPYFLRELTEGYRYIHPCVSPNKRDSQGLPLRLDWARYAARFEVLMDERTPDAPTARVRKQPCRCAAATLTRHCRLSPSGRRARLNVEIIHLEGR